MNVLNDIFRSNDFLGYKKIDKIFLDEIAIDIFGNIAAFGRNHKLFSFETLRLRKVV